MQKNKYLNLTLFAIFAIYIIILMKITVIRGGISLNNLFSHGKINLLPFVDYMTIISKNKWQQFIYLFIGNIIWFIPFGVIMPLIFKRNISLFSIALYGFLLSLFIEIAQYTFGTGISEIDDLILNTVGVVIGYIVINLIKRNCKQGVNIK